LVGVFALLKSKSKLSVNLARRKIPKKPSLNDNREVLIQKIGKYTDLIFKQKSLQQDLEDAKRFYA